MKRAAIFFDRDNTLIVNDAFLGDAGAVKLIDGAADAVARARQYGFRVVTFSNQSGVARGLFTEDAVQAVNRKMDELLQAANASAIIERHAYCPYHPEATVEQYRQDSFLRKPKPGMILKLAEELNLDLGRSWVVGDAPRDIEAGKAAGCRTVLFQDPNLAASPATEVCSSVQPDFVVSSLPEAIDLIAKEAFKSVAVKPEAAAVAAAVERETKEEEACPPAADWGDESGGDGAAAAGCDRQGRESPVVAAPASAAGPRAVEMPARQGEGSRLENLAEQILLELRRRREQEPVDFSVSKLMAGIVQVLALAVLFLGYLSRENPASLQSTLLFAIALQVLTVALLIMGKQR